MLKTKQELDEEKAKQDSNKSPSSLPKHPKGFTVLDIDEVENYPPSRKVKNAESNDRKKFTLADLV
jgi:hypothetical protein